MTVTSVRDTAARWQFWILLLGVGIVVGLVAQLLSGEDSETYGLENTDLDGYAALANVLDDHGVEHQRAHSAAAARSQLEENPEAGVVVVVNDVIPEERFIEELAEERSVGRNVLWISEETALLADLLEDEVQSGPLTSGVLEAGTECAHPAAQAAQSIQAEGGSLESEYGCFPVGDAGYALVDTPLGLVFTLPEAFTNQNITQQGNAALALGLLGARTVPADSAPLIWYTPSGADAVDADQWGSPFDYLPAWFWPLIWWLMICAVLALLAAGRRPGPVVSEPVPVVVPAAEAAVGRGRLYQRANAVAESAEVLRSAHLIRLSRLLRLGRAARAAQIAEAASRVTGQDASIVAEPARVSTNNELVSYAQALEELEAEVTRAVRMQRSFE